MTHKSDIVREEFLGMNQEALTTSLLSCEG